MGFYLMILTAITPKPFAHKTDRTMTNPYAPASQISVSQIDSTPGHRLDKFSQN
jgi:hypothetical protein